MAPILKLAVADGGGARAREHAARVAQARAPGVRHRRRRRARRRDALRARPPRRSASGEERAVPGVQGEEGAQAGPPPRELLLGQGPRRRLAGSLPDEDRRAKLADRRAPSR